VAARFTRPGLIEEYSVSMDGVRQDFIIEQRPVGTGPLRLELDVAGAEAEPLAGGARLVLENSGRKIAYSRLRVTDATGKELTARMEVSDGRNGLNGGGTVTVLNVVFPQAQTQSVWCALSEASETIHLSGLGS
jgi:hypothetical protein